MPIDRDGGSRGEVDGDGKGREIPHYFRHHAVFEDLSVEDNFQVSLAAVKRQKVRLARTQTLNKTRNLQASIMNCIDIDLKKST